MKFFVSVFLLGLVSFGAQAASCQKIAEKVAQKNMEINAKTAGLPSPDLGEAIMRRTTSSNQVQIFDVEAAFYKAEYNVTVVMDINCSTTMVKIDPK